MNKWKMGIPGELSFWRGWISRKKDEYNRPRRLSSLFDFMIAGKKEVLIANLGAGAINLIGDHRKDVNVKVISSDFLANEYSQMWKDLGVEVLSPVEYQDMTKMSYPDKTFDIVFCANALDHCVSPYLALLEMIRICKDDGWIYLEHICHEGRRHSYTNFHLWNIDITENGDCKICTKHEGKRFLLSSVYPGFTNIVKTFSKGSMIKSFVKKNGTR